MTTTAERLWPPPPADLSLAGNEIHLWQASLDLPALPVQNLRQTLAADELGRAKRFHFQKDRERFIVTRGVLRAILSRYLHIAPQQLRFTYSPYGKPALAHETGGDTLCFNLSHSHDLALYAITRNRQVGIDLEYLRALPDMEQVAQRFFSAQENSVLDTLPQNQRLEAFFNCWTRKEAYIKARGEGLSFRLDQFDVSLMPGEPAALLTVRGDSCEAARWSLQELEPAPGYVAALAVEGHGWHLHCWQWP